MSEDRIKKLVDKFLCWPLPPTVRPDASPPESPHARHNSGTNLLTADEARQMIEHLLEPGSYQDIEEQIRNAPMTWLPALLLIVVEETYRRKVFKPGGASITIQKLEMKLFKNPVRKS